MLHVANNIQNIGFSIPAKISKRLRASTLNRIANGIGSLLLTHMKNRTAKNKDVNYKPLPKPSGKYAKVKAKLTSNSYPGRRGQKRGITQRKFNRKASKHPLTRAYRANDRGRLTGRFVDSWYFTNAKGLQTQKGLRFKMTFKFPPKFDEQYEGLSENNGYEIFGLSRNFFNKLTNTERKNMIQLIKREI